MCIHKYCIHFWHSLTVVKSGLGTTNNVTLDLYCELRGKPYIKSKYCVNTPFKERSAEMKFVKK